MFIDIKNARKHYGDGETLVNALDGVSLSLGEGKIYVICLLYTSELPTILRV